MAPLDEGCESFQFEALLRAPNVMVLCPSPGSVRAQSKTQSLSKELLSQNRQDEQRGPGRRDDLPDILKGTYQRNDTPAVQENRPSNMHKLNKHM